MILLKVEYLPGDRDPKPIWLWSSALEVDSAQLDRIWRTFLRRFDLEHTFRLMKQTLGWTRPKVRSPEAADLWTWLIIAAYTQLRLARPLAEDLRRPWERPAPPRRLRKAPSEHGGPEIPVWRSLRSRTDPASVFRTCRGSATDRLPTCTNNHEAASEAVLLPILTCVSRTGVRGGPPVRMIFRSCAHESRASW